MARSADQPARCAPRSGRLARRPRRRSTVRVVRRTATKEAAADELATGLERLTDLQDRLWAEGKRRCSSCSRASTPPARTARSITSWAPSTRRAARSRRSRCRPPRSSRTTTCGGSTSGCRARARSRSSTAPTTRTCSSSASTTSRPRRSGRARYDQINEFERLLADEGTTIVKFFLCDRPRRAARAVPGTARRPDEALEVPPRRPRRAEALGRLPWRPTRTRCRRARRTGRRGTSSRRTGSGSATSRSPRSWPTRSTSSTRVPGAAGPAGRLVVE